MEGLGKIERTLLSPLEAFRGHQQAITDEQMAWASRHAEHSNGLLVPLDDDSHAYPGQRYSILYLNGERQLPDNVRVTATMADPLFSELESQLAEQESATGEVSRIGEMLRAGQKVIAVTNHAEIKDVAEVLAAFYNQLHERDYHPDTSLIVAKQVAYLGFLSKEMPAVDMLKTVCSREYLSFPRTASTQDSKIDQAFISLYNGILKKLMDLHHQHAENGTLFAMAASGTTDKALNPENPDEITLSPIGPSARLMIGNMVVPIAVWTQGNTRLLKICDYPRYIADEVEANAVMDVIAGTLSHELGRPFVYNSDSVRKLGGTAISS